jgi:rhamnulokinase/L-fuculokinase
MTANACHKRVSAGPVEATVYGNLVLQLISSGELGSIEEARELIRKSPDIKIYEPENETAWEDAYHRYLEVTKG